MKIITHACCMGPYFSLSKHTGWVSKKMSAAVLTEQGSAAVTCQHAVEDAYTEACRHELLPQALSSFWLTHLHRWLHVMKLLLHMSQACPRQTRPL